MGTATQHLARQSSYIGVRLRDNGLWQGYVVTEDGGEIDCGSYAQASDAALERDRVAVSGGAGVVLNFPWYFR